MSATRNIPEGVVVTGPCAQAWCQCCDKEVRAVVKLADFAFYCERCLSDALALLRAAAEPEAKGCSRCNAMPFYDGIETMNRIPCPECGCLP